MGHANTPPSIPEVKDEAGESPRWLPGLGLALFALLVAWVLYSHRAAGGSDATVEGSDSAEAAP